MKNIINHSLILISILFVSLFANAQDGDLISIAQMDKPFYAFGGLQLDSSININYIDATDGYKFVYEYSRDGRTSLEEFYSGFDITTNKWIGVTKGETTFLIGGGATFIGYVWDYATSEWVYSRQVYDIFGLNKRSSSIIYLDWDTSTQSFELSSKEEYEYDAFDNLLKLTTYEWKNSTWTNYSKHSYSYDDNNNLTSTVTTNWSGSNWVNDMKYTITYNVDGQVKSEEYFQWNTTKKAWIALMQTNYTYIPYGAANGKISTKAQWIWDSSKNEYVGYNKTKYTYDDKGYLQIRESQESAGGYLWNTNAIETYVRDANDNILSYTYEFVSLGPLTHNEHKYDNNNNRISTVSYTWDKKTSNWIKSSEEKREYDTNNNLLSIAFYDNQNILTSKTTYYYSASNYCSIDIDLDYTYVWDGKTPEYWYSGDSIAAITKINNNSTESFTGSLALQLINEEDDNISQFIDIVDKKNSEIDPRDYQFVRFEGKIIVPKGKYLVYLLYKESNNDDWKLAGATEGYFNPDTFVVSEKEIIKEYVILAQRKVNTNWYYLTSVNAGTIYTPHLEAINSGTPNKSLIQTSNLADKYIWNIEESNGSILLKNGEEYISYSSGNTAYMSVSGRLLSANKIDDGLTQYWFVDSSNATRYLSLNTNNDYFSFYKGTQAQNLLVLEYGFNPSTFVENISIDANSPNKLLRNGQIYILRGNNTYTVTGQLVK